MRNEIYLNYQLKKEILNLNDDLNEDENDGD